MQGSLQVFPSAQRVAAHLPTHTTGTSVMAAPQQQAAVQPVTLTHQQGLIQYQSTYQTQPVLIPIHYQLHTLCTAIRPYLYQALKTQAMPGKQSISAQQYLAALVRIRHIPMSSMTAHPPPIHSLHPAAHHHSAILFLQLVSSWLITRSRIQMDILHPRL